MLVAANTAMQVALGLAPIVAKRRRGASVVHTCLARAAARAAVRYVVFIVVPPWSSSHQALGAHTAADKAVGAKEHARGLTHSHWEHVLRNYVAALYCHAGHNVAVSLAW